MTAEIDFSHLNRFPGETGNPFDVVLHRVEFIQRIPAIMFGGLLLLLAAASARLDWTITAVLWSFFLSDWLLLELLPRFRRSFGPAKPSVLILAFLRAIFGLLPSPWNIVLQVVGTLLVIYAFWFEPHRLTVTHQILKTTKLPKDTHLRVLHLGDLHIERISQREIDLQKQIDQLKPDLILFSGDILNLSYRNDPVAMEQARQIIMNWKAPLGVYMVSGSPAVDLAENMPGILKGLPVHWLQNDRIEIPVQDSMIDLIGLTCSHRPHVDGPKLEKLVSHLAQRFTIFLYHTPDLAPISARLGIDLQLSGHTHGGQVRIPGFGALFTGSLYGKRFEAGRISVGSLTLYVTRGIGMEGAAAPRVRFFCPPEIILWDIQGDTPNL